MVDATSQILIRWGEEMPTLYFGGWDGPLTDAFGTPLPPEFQRGGREYRRR